MKKKIAGLVLAFVLIIASSTSAMAASSSVSAMWYTGNAGSVNGKANGVFHSLDSGNAYLKGRVNGATATYPVVAILYQEKTFFDTKYETVYIDDEYYGTYLIGKGIPKSDRYYIQMGAGTHDTMHTFDGSLSNTK